MTNIDGPCNDQLWNEKNLSCSIAAALDLCFQRDTKRTEQSQRTKFYMIFILMKHVGKF